MKASVYGESSHIPLAEIAVERVDANVIRWSVSIDGVSVETDRLAPIPWTWPARLSDATFRLFGPFRRVDEWPTSWPAWVFLHEEREPQPGDMAVQLFRQIGFRADTVPFVEQLWTDNGLHSSIRDADLPGVTQADVARVQALFPILQAFDQRPERRGRPSGSTSLTLEEFAEREPRVRRQIEDDTGEPADDADVAAGLGISVATYYRYKDSRRRLGNF